MRDIGFVDLVGPQYTLSHHAAKDEALTDPGRALLGALARDGNVARGDASEGAPGWWLTRDGLEPLKLLAAGRDEAAARAAWTEAVHSPVRDRLLAETLGSFAILVHVHGAEEADQARIGALIEKGRAGLEVLEATLPRPIDRPLLVLEVPAAARESERVLLWSLGVDPAGPGPALAVVYGRGKLAGKVMAGAMATEHELLAQLALVGESCECDTPRDWFGEPRVPLAWTDRQRARAGAELGFDPESPMVKSEVVRILERGPMKDGAPRDPNPTGVESLVLGYREVALEDETAPAPMRDFEPDGAPSTAEAPGKVYEATADDDWGFDEDEPAGPVVTTAPPSETSTGAPPDDAPSSRRSLGLASMLVAAFVGIVVLSLAAFALSRRGSSA